MTTKELLDQAYLENKVNSIIEPMIVQLVTIQPEDPVEFMIKWIKKNYGDKGSLNKNKRFHLERLREEIKKLTREENKNK